MSAFAENLRNLRESRGISKSQMAKALQLTLPGYSFYEKGEREPGPTKLQKIADVLHVTVDDLLKSSIQGRATQSAPSDNEKFEAIFHWQDAGFTVREREDGYILIEPPEELSEQLSPLEITEGTFFRLTNKMLGLMFFQPDDREKFATMACIIMNRKAALRRENPFNLVGQLVPLEYLPRSIEKK